MADESTLPEDEPSAAAPRATTLSPALVIVWSREEPWRAGEVSVVPLGTAVSIGRGGGGEGDDSPDDAASPANSPAGSVPPGGQFGRHRPGLWLPSPPLAARAISRRQLVVRGLDGGRIRVVNEGRCALAVRGVAVDEADCEPGDLLQVGRQLLLLCTRWPDRLLGDPSMAATFAPGDPDPYGIVGESPAAWTLRARAAHVARRAGHVLITGPSGAGKELVARAIHAGGGARAPMVSRSAATIPDTLVDVELFGNARNYPNPGTPERRGLVGEADGTSLFLDEIGELPAASQAHLLRVMDGGEYHRLGESRARTSRFRLLAATNRAPGALKADFAARFTFHLSVPDLNERREDIPLLVEHILRSAARRGDPAALELFPGRDATAKPRVPLELAHAALTYRYTTNVRELERLVHKLLAAALMGQDGLDGIPRAATSDADAEVEWAAADDSAVHEDLGADRIQRALDENNGSIERAWRALGLRNRFVLHRLVRKHGIEIRRKPT